MNIELTLNNYLLVATLGCVASPFGLVLLSDIKQREGFFAYLLLNIWFAGICGYLTQLPIILAASLWGLVS